MCSPNQYDLALSFWTVSFEYLEPVPKARFSGNE
jgi:hypothetical protein